MKHYLAAEKTSEEKTKRHKMLINDRKHLVDRIENIHEAIAKIANWKSFSLDRPPSPREMCCAHFCISVRNHI
jgi:hypothetical protein